MTPQEAREIIIEERDSLKANPMVKVEDCLYEALDLAIKALEQQPCEDAISRTELLRRIDAERNHLLDIKMDGAEHIIVHHARRIIEDMPTVKPQQRWIPVSERLPEDNIHVLCQFTLGGMGECYLAHGVFHVVGGLVMTCNEVIAWMPLPKPYKAESEE